MELNSEVLELLSRLKSLNVNQINSLQMSARNQVFERIGAEPKHNEFKSRVTWRSVIQFNDWLGIILFVVLLTISLIHMVTFTGGLAETSYESGTENGIFIGLAAWVIAHQLTFFAFSELGVLFFFIRHTMGYLRWKDPIEARLVQAEESGNDALAARYKEQLKKGAWRHWVSVAASAAVACALVAVLANITSLVANEEQWSAVWFVKAAIGALIPLLTLFLGERAAEILMEFLYAKERAQTEWLQAHVAWKQSRDAVEKYDEKDGINSYRRYLAAHIVQHYWTNIEPRLSSDQRIPQDKKTPELELALAAREIARLRRMSDIDDMVETFFISPPSEEGTTLASTPTAN